MRIGFCLLLLAGCTPSLEDQLRMHLDGGMPESDLAQPPVTVSPAPVVVGTPQPAKPEADPSGSWTAAPSLGDVQFVPNRDSVILQLPAFSGAVDYRAIIDNSKIAVTANSDGTEAIAGTTVICAGYLQRNTRRADRELLQVIELPGLSGATRVVVEAVDHPCPYTGVIGGTHDDLDRTTAVNPEIKAADSAHYTIFTEDDVVKTYGATILNGQGSDNGSGQPAPNLAPKVLARTTVTVTPGGNGAAPVKSFFDDFSTADPPKLLVDGTTCYPSQGCNHPFIDILQNQKWTFEPASMDKTQYFYDRGQLHSVVADGGADGFSSTIAYPRQLAHVADSQYLHITWEVNSMTTQRRYWWISVCGADQPGKTISADGSPASYLHPDSSLQLADGNNPNLSGYNCLMLFPKDGNNVFGLPMGDGTESPPETDARVLIYKSGTGVTGVNVNPDQYKNGWISPSWFRMQDGAGNLVGPMLDFNNLNFVGTHFDLYVRKGRALFYVDGKQKLCNDFSPSLITMSEAMVGFGQVLYHTSAEHNELATDPTDPNNSGPPRMKHVYENLKYLDRRDWDNLGFEDGAGAPADFDASRCYLSTAQ